MLVIACGLTLLLAGGVLFAALALARSAAPQSRPAPYADGGAAEAASSPTSTVPPASETTVSSAPAAYVLDSTGDTVPYWKAKQEEARRREAEAAAQESAAGTTTTSATGAASGQTQNPAPSPTTTATTQAPVATTRVVGSGGSTPLEGVWGGTAKELADYLLAANPSPRFTVPTLKLAEYYVRYAAQVKLRADVLWAQMIHETGYGKYGGSVVPEQNNYAGIGATGGGAPGYAFASAELGVQAHVAHMVAYVYPADMASWTNPTVDPRYDMVRPRGVARVLRDLDGRWAVPGVGYGERIERHLSALNR